MELFRYIVNLLTGYIPVTSGHRAGPPEVPCICVLFVIPNVSFSSEPDAATSKKLLRVKCSVAPHYLCWSLAWQQLVAIKKKTYQIGIEWAQHSTFMLTDVLQMWTIRSPSSAPSCSLENNCWVTSHSTSCIRTTQTVIAHLAPCLACTSRNLPVWTCRNFTGSSFNSVSMAKMFILLLRLICVKWRMSSKILLKGSSCSPLIYYFCVF